MKNLVNTYISLIETSYSDAEINRIVDKAANDDGISNAEYELIYTVALDRLRK